MFAEYKHSGCFLRSETCWRKNLLHKLWRWDSIFILKKFGSKFSHSHLLISCVTMADFPSKVTTETSAHQSQQSDNSLRGLTASVTNRMDISFIRSIPAILMTAEIFLGMIHWALIASTNYTRVPAYGWVMFVAVTFWILTTILFFVILFCVQLKITFIPWPLTVMVYHGVATVLYLTAFLTNAASVKHLSTSFYNHTAAASFFGAVVTVVYGISTFFFYLDWRGNGGNAATSTVPT